jgi:hypothetical protein
MVMEKERFVMVRRRRMLLAVLAALGFAVCAASPASADSARCTSGCGAYAYFVSYGEHLFVEDRAADGHSAVAVWYTPWTGTRYVWNPHGAFGARVDGNLSLAEGTGLSYMVCLGEYGSRTVLWNTCSNPVADRA